MIYSSRIVVKDDKKELYSLFAKYDEKFDRSEMIVSHKEGNLVITVNANDSVALRASLNGITKLFTVYEKMSDLTDEE